MARKKEIETSPAPKKSLLKKVQFEFPAPDAHEVCVVGEFNDWDVHANPMKKDKKGGWKATLSLAPGRYQYRFVADGQWESDPACSDCLPNEFGSTNSVRTVP